MVETIDILGFPHAYERSTSTNSSPVLVFVHGWLLSRAYWQPIVQRLAPDYQCLSYDLRGFGASQPSSTAQSIRAVGLSRGSSVIQTQVAERATVPSGTAPSGSTWSGGGRSPHLASFSPDPSELQPESQPKSKLTALTSTGYTPADYAQDLHLLLQRLNITNAWLIGHSLGGSIALWAADQFPSTIAGVICVNSGGGIYLKEEFERFRAAGEQLIKYRPRWLAYLPLLDLALTRMNVARPIARRWGRQRLLDLLTAQPEAALGTLLDSTTETEVHRLPQVVARLQQPVHFIAGASDTIMEPKYVHHLASFHLLFQSCGNNVSEIPNCGHLAMVEQPEAVTDEIRAILAKYDHIS